MPEYLAPGVYVEEISTGPKPIEGVSTSTAGFVGAAERGPESPRFIASWLEFQRWYGYYIPNTSFLADAVQGFFDNGGKRCFVSRIVGTGATGAQLDVASLRVWAVGRGSWGDRVRIRVDRATEAIAGRKPDWFRVRVLYYTQDPVPFLDPTDPANATKPERRDPDVVEDYDNLTFVPLASNNVVTVINAASHLVRVWWSAAPQRPPDTPLTPLAPAANPGADIDAGDFIGTRDPLPVPGAVQNTPADLLGRGTGLAAIELVDEVSLVCVPDVVHPSLDANNRQNLINQVIDQCERLKDRFAIISAERGQSDITNLRPPRDTSYAAFYYPWIQIYDPILSDTRLVPPTGHVAGIFARTDIERGVHKAPANEVVRGALDLELPVTKEMQDVLNPRGVNCIRDFRGDRRGIRLWGARTMSSDPEWKYVNVRRLFLFIEESVDEGTQWVVFEPNADPLWAQVRRTLVNFLVRVWKSGALMGLTQDEAFFVKCDRTTMTQDDIDNGRLICYIGVAPVKPAEFVIFRISQKTADAPA